MFTFLVDLTLRFPEDVNLDEIEKILGMKATSKKTKQESKSKNKFARISFYTSRKRSPNPSQVLENFLLKIHENIKKVPEILKKYNGRAFLCLIMNFSEYVPTVFLSQTVIDILSECKIEFDLDFM